METLLNLEKKIKDLITKLLKSQNFSLAEAVECPREPTPKLASRRQKERRSLPPSFKREKTLVLILTEKCNLRCAYCLRDTRQDSKEIPFPVLKRIILSAHRFGINEISITGGEMFIYPQWRELVKLIESLGSSLFIETNGYDLKEEDVVFLKNALADRITKIMVSLDSYDAKIHDQFRGQGTFDRAVSAIRLLRKHHIPVEVNLLLTPST